MAWRPVDAPSQLWDKARMRPIHVIGGGLAGSEAAWQAAEAGVPVVLHEMRPTRMTAAHRTGRLAELVCSNSFRSDDASTNAVGVLHREAREVPVNGHQLSQHRVLLVDVPGALPGRRRNVEPARGRRRLRHDH